MEVRVHWSCDTKLVCTLKNTFQKLDCTHALFQEDGQTAVLTGSTVTRERSVSSS